MAEKRRTLTHEEMAELTGYMGEASERHVTNVAGFMPRHVTRVIDVDVNLGLWDAILPAGGYQTRLPDEHPEDGEYVPDELLYLWTADLTEESARKLAEDAADGTAIEWDGAAEVEEPPTIDFKLTRVNVAEGRPLLYTELLAWLAIQDADEAGDEEKADRILYLAYGLHRGGGEQITLPRQDTITPHRQYDPDTKAANLMTEAAMFTEAGALLDVAGAGERKRNKSVDVAVSFSVDEGVELSRDISAYDREVHRAISSRWVAGNRNITATQIANDMGMPKPTPNQIRKVEESIELQRRIIGSIDFSAEARGRKLLFPDGTPVDEFIVDGHLLDMEGITMRAANGREVRGYHLDKAPLLYRHAAAVGQVISYPQRWLEFGEGSATDKNMLLRSQLLRQVSRIKNPKWKKSSNIRFTTDPKHPDRPCLFSRAGINQKDRHARKDATDYVISVLDDLKRDGAIKGYTLNQQTVRGGKSTYGVTIKP